jgi:hypothetical protein
MDSYHKVRALTVRHIFATQSISIDVLPNLIRGCNTYKGTRNADQLHQCFGFLSTNICVCLAPRLQWGADTIQSFLFVSGWQQKFLLLLSGS